MEIRKIWIGDEALLAMSSDTLQQQIGMLRGTASFCDNPDAIRTVITQLIYELARKHGGDFIEGSLTFPASTVKPGREPVFEAAFTKFSHDIEKITDASLQRRGKHWEAIAQKINEGHTAIAAWNDIR